MKSSSLPRAAPSLPGASYSLAKYSSLPLLSLPASSLSEISPFRNGLLDPRKIIIRKMRVNKKTNYSDFVNQLPETNKTTEVSRHYYNFRLRVLK